MDSRFRFKWPCVKIGKTAVINLVLRTDSLGSSPASIGTKMKISFY